MFNKISSFIIIIVVITASCKKEPATKPLPQPLPVVEMVYTYLNNREVKYQQNGVTLDVNKDGRADLLFDAYVIGDPLNVVDKRQYYVLSSGSTALPVNINEQVPPLNLNDVITLGNFNGNSWHAASEIVLMERNLFGNGTIVWRGNWLDLQKKYLPFQILSNNQRYNGWVELSADKTGERLVLHRMAISKQPEKVVRAGE